MPWLRIFIEGTVVVVSILLAFGIDAWWDNRLESRERGELLRSLTEDFEWNRSELARSIEEVESVHGRLTTFLLASSRPDSVPLDSLRNLFRAVISPPSFQPAMAAYRAALAAGRLGSLENPGLVEAMVRFEDALQLYELLDALAAEQTFLGSTFELRKELGSISVLTGPTTESSDVPERFRKTAAEYREYVQLPHVYAHVENLAVLRRNQLNALRRMEEAVEAVLHELRTSR